MTARPYRYLSILMVLAFVAGILVRSLEQDRRDRERAEKLAAEVRGCVHYVVVRQDGTMECRAMQPRLDFVLPVPMKPSRKIVHTTIAQWKKAQTK